MAEPHTQNDGESPGRDSMGSVHRRVAIPPPRGKGVEHQHDVRDPFRLGTYLRESEPPITANTSRKRRIGTPSGVAGFYLEQNKKIHGMLKSVEEHEQEAKDSHGSNNVLYRLCTQGSLVANIILSGLQLYAAVSSGSLSLFTTMADSIFDPFAGIMLYLSHRAVNKVDRHKYPAGRARISTAANITFAFLMFSVSLVLIVMSATELGRGSTDETNAFHLPSVIAVAIAFATKLGLFFLCWTIKDVYSQVDILWRDHRNDLFINSFGILTSVGGSKIKWWIDPMGAMLLSFLIAGLWIHTAVEEFQQLIGVSADIDTLQLITYTTMAHSPLLLKIDKVYAYHSGPRLMVEVDVVMDRNERLEIVHDVAEDLQMKLEKFPFVERAFVHIDYETSHKPEHDLKKLM